MSRWLVLRALVGLALFALGLWRLSVCARDSIAWPVLDARPVTSIDPANEGALVAITGAIESDARANDPEYVLPTRWLVLRRAIAAPVKDDDDSVEWRAVTRAGTVTSFEDRVGEATVAGLRVRVRDARIAPGALSPLVIDEASLRTDSRPAGVAYARWRPARGEFVGGADAVPDGAELHLDAKGDDPAENARVRMWLQGFEQGERVLAVGRQRGAALEPASMMDGLAPVVVLTRPRPLAEVAEDLEPVGPGSFAWACVAFGGLLLAFMHPGNVAFWAISMGFGALVAAFIHDFWVGARNLAVGVAGLAACVITFVLATTPPRGAAPFWATGVAVALACAARFLLPPSELDEGILWD